MHLHWNNPPNMIYSTVQIAPHSPGCAGDHLEELKWLYEKVASAHKQHNDGANFATYFTVLGDLDVVHQFAPVTDLSILEAGAKDPGSKQIMAAVHGDKHPMSAEVKVTERFELLRYNEAHSVGARAVTGSPEYLVHVKMRCKPQKVPILLRAIEKSVDTHKHNDTGAAFSTYTTVVGDFNVVHQFARVNSLSDIAFGLEDPGFGMTHIKHHGARNAVLYQEWREEAIAWEEVSVLRLGAEQSHLG